MIKHELVNFHGDSRNEAAGNSSGHSTGHSSVNKHASRSNTSNAHACQSLFAVLRLLRKHPASKRSARPRRALIEEYLAAAQQMSFHSKGSLAAAARSEARSAFAHADKLESLPHAKTHASFLEANAQSHADPFHAFADIIDNSREARALRCSINTRDEKLLEITDDGEGMSEYTLSCAISIAYTSKDFTTGKHYGMGVTTAIPRLGKSALCFSVHRESGHYTLAMLSSQLSKNLGADELKLPQCSWYALMPGAIVQDQVRQRTPFSTQQRHQSLDVILQYSHFESEAALLAEFTDLGESGTKWLCWNVRTDELDLKVPCEGRMKQPPADIRLFGKKPFGPKHESSLRAYLEVLYYYDNEIAQRPVMTMELQGKPIVPRNWSTYLHQQSSASYKPQGAPIAVAKMAFGYALPLPDVVTIFEDKNSSKSRPGSEYHQICMNHGVFYYHQGHDPTMPARLMLPAEPTKLQKKETAAMKVTHMRLATLGYALIGCCRENFLVQGHNKSQYVLTEGGVDAQQHTVGTLQVKTNDKMADYLKALAPRITKLTSSTPRNFRRDRGAVSGGMDESDEEEDMVDDDLVDKDIVEEAVLEQEIASGAREALVAASSSKVDEVDEIEIGKQIQEGDRYVVCVSDHVVGYISWVSGKKHRLLRLCREPTSKPGKATYRPSEVRRAQLDTSSINMIPWRLLTISALNGATVEVWWQNNAQDVRIDGKAGEWFKGHMVPKSDMAPGWFEVVYEEIDDYDQSELVFIGIRADADDQHSEVAFREDGSNFEEEIRIDPVAIKAAAEPAQPQQQQFQQLPAGHDEFASFFAAASFTGAHSGYIFKMGEQGLGYYRDQVGAGELSRLPSASLLETSGSSTSTIAPAARAAASGETHREQRPSGSVEQQVELKQLRDQLTRREAKHETEISEYAAQTDSLREKLQQMTTARDSAEKKLGLLRKQYETQAKQQQTLMKKNAELNDKLQQEQRRARASQRVEMTMAPIPTPPEPPQQPPQPPRLQPTPPPCVADDEVRGRVEPKAAPATNVGGTTEPISPAPAAEDDSDDDMPLSSMAISMKASHGAGQRGADQARVRSSCVGDSSSGGQCSPAPAAVASAREVGKAGTYTARFSVGARVLVKFDDGIEYLGTVNAVGIDAVPLYSVRFDDGDDEDDVKEEEMRLPRAHSELVEGVPVPVGAAAVGDKDEGDGGGGGGCGGDLVLETAGVQLQRSKRYATGYQGVTCDHKRFRADHRLDGKRTYLGMFDTAVEAAVAYAKHVHSLSAGAAAADDEAEAEIVEDLPTASSKAAVDALAARSTVPKSSASAAGSPEGRSGVAVGTNQPEPPNLHNNPILQQWQWNSDGSLAGRVYGKEGFKQGEAMNTSVVPENTRYSSYVVTESGSIYRLGDPHGRHRQSNAPTCDGHGQVQLNVGELLSSDSGRKRKADDMGGCDNLDGRVNVPNKHVAVQSRAADVVATFPTGVQSSASASKASTSSVASWRQPHRPAKSDTVLASSNQPATSTEVKPPAATNAADEVNPQLGDYVQVEWLRGACGIYKGVVDNIDHVISSERTCAFEYRYHVLYDDGDKRWETMSDVTTRLKILVSAKPTVQALPTRLRGQPSK